MTVVGTSYNANAIDVSTVQSSTVFAAEVINQLPLGQNVQSVALLAPSVVANSSYASNAPSFGGSASSENSYYINGYAVTNPLSSIGFSTLPFDGIDQMEVMTGGYGVAYGRSTGGVIAVTTKRGTNDWHFGAVAQYTPDSLRGTYRNYYYPDTGYWDKATASSPATDGKLYQKRDINELDSWKYGLYASGPIIKDRLFFYASAELSKSTSSSINANVPTSLYDTNPNNDAAAAKIKNGWRENESESPRWLVKLDWQINDNHSLEFTGVQDRTKSESTYNNLNAVDWTHDNTVTNFSQSDDNARLYVGRYIGHFTDSLSLSVVYGKQDVEHPSFLEGYRPDCPSISGGTGSTIRPGLAGSQGCQPFNGSSIDIDGATEGTKGGRIDLDWVIGAHTLRVGYDANQADTSSSTQYAGGYRWVYQATENYNDPIDGDHGVGAPGAVSGTPTTGTQGWYVYKLYFTNGATVQTKQKAYYLEDRWQLTDNFILSLGVRNENFTNYNGDHKVYVEQKNQWAPRLGFTWDAMGDSTLKVFGSAGRYHLAIPNVVAARQAASSLYTLEYFNYTGIDPTTGAPTGATPIIPDKSLGWTCPGTNAVSSNLECGNARDPRVVAAKDLKPHYQDEFIIGFQHQYSDVINWGMKWHWRDLKSAIDDTCTGILGGECFIFNPGVGNTFYQKDASGNLVEKHYTAEQLGFPKLKRKYWALDAYIEHALTNNWYGRLEYSFSRNYGNAEGQLQSDLDTGGGGQSDVSQTVDWDKPALMEHAYGLLPNHRAHQLKAYGYYKFTDEFRVGASAIITSGRPLSCTSYYPAAVADTYSGAYHHWCGLPPSTTYPNGLDYRVEERGSTGSTPWTQQLNLNAEYRPNWANKKLSFQVDVLNVLDQQAPQFKYSRFGQARNAVNRRYMQDMNYMSPRSVRFTVRYDY